jgi:PKD repeat protein
MLKKISLFILVAVFASCTKEPTASFTPNQTSVYEGETITFNNTSDDTESSEWDFGDGSSSTDDSPSHKFTAPGTYNVTLTAFSKKKKKSSNAVSTIQVTQATMHSTVAGQPLILTLNNALITHGADNSLYPCGGGTSTGIYSTLIEQASGQQYIDIAKGTLSWTCSNPAPIASFMNFFSAGSYNYSANAQNGIEIQYRDANGTIYSTSNGTDQSGSTFVITSVRQENVLGSDYARITGTFSCKVYDSAGTPLQISGTFFDFPFENL